MKPYKKIFSEFVRLSDLAGDQGMSKFSLKHRKIRASKMGSESRIAKLVDIKINPDKDYIDFFFLTEVTKGIYKPGHKYKDAEFPNYRLTPNPSKTYTIIIRILNFFELLNTTPGTILDITDKDIEDVLNVANVQVADSTPSFNYQGGAYYLSQLDGAIYPQSIAPKFWNQAKYHGDGNVFLSKNSQGILNNIKFFIPMMRMKIKKELHLTK